MAAQGWLSEDDAEDALSAADNQGWISEEEHTDDGDSSADLEASEQAGSWAEAIGLSDVSDPTPGGVGYSPGTSHVSGSRSS